MNRLLLAGFTVLVAGSAAAAPPYVTQEFQQGESHIATAFICGIVGQQTGIEPEAMVWVVQMVKDAGVDSAHAGRLLADSVVWMDAEGSQIDLMQMWVGECKEPIRVIGEAYGE